MKIDHLVAHGLDPRIIDNWKKHYTDVLLPSQARAVTDTGLLRGGNLIVFAPTSSGKTFIAEMAALKHIQNNRKALFLVPSKSLAEEQYARFHEVYSPLHLKVVVATRERTLHDTQIQTGAFHLAVMVYEKFKAFLASSPQILSRLGIVVADELQILGDKERGTVVDLLLAKILASGKPVQFLGLSAVVGENIRLSQWLKSDFFVWKERAVELREGVFRICDGQFVYHEVNSGVEGEETLISDCGYADARNSPECSSGRRVLIPPDASNFQFPAIEILTQELASRGEQVLVFVPTRHLCRQWAFQLSHSLPLEAADEALQELSTHEPSHSRQLLEQCLMHSVAFHNADLPHDLRALVEQQFNSGAVRVLVATATLAQGVNLSGRNVISVPVMIAGDALTGNPVFVPLSRQRFRNQGGRAGRYARGEEFGRSILVAEDEWEAERMMREFVFGDVEALEPPATEQALDIMALDLIQSGIANDMPRLNELLLGTYAGMTGWGAFPQRFQAQLEDCLERLERAKLIGRSAKGRLAPTGIGQAAAAYGISVETACDFAAYCDARKADSVDPLEILALCTFSSDGAMLPLSVSATEVTMLKYPRMLDAHREICLADLPEVLQAKLRPQGGFCEKGHEALKKMFLAEAWISQRPTGDIEGEFRVFAGTIANLGAHLSWLAQALGAFASNLGMSTEQVGTITQLALRLPEGVDTQGAALAELGVRGLTRMHIADLARAGFDTPQAISEASVALLTSYLPQRLAERLHQAACEALDEVPVVREEFAGWFPKRVTERQHAPGDNRAFNVGQTFLSAQGRQECLPHIESSIPTLVIDERNTGQVTFHGQTIALSGLPWRLLLLLAKRPQETVSYEEIKNALWPHTKVERKQVHQHKAAIVHALAQAVETHEQAEIVATVNGHGIRLMLAPEQVIVKQE